jgi:hypothetical protein
VALEERNLRIVFNIGLGTYGLGGFSSFTVERVRATARVANAGGAALPSLDLTVYGLTLSQMNQLMTLGQVITTQRANFVSVFAGSTGGPMTKVFDGSIVNAWADFNASPDVAMRVMGSTGTLEALKPTTPSSYAQAVAVEDALAQLAQQVGWQFENNGVHVMLPVTYVASTAREQMLELVQQAGIEWNAGEGNVLAIWPRGQFRKGTISIVSPSTGLVGYPTFIPNGISIRTLFNPAIRFGSQVQVKDSFVKQANGTYTTFNITHSLASQTPRGPWFSDIDCVVPGYQPVPT